MRQLVSDDYILDNTSSHPIVFVNGDGHKIRIYIIDSHVVRVQHTVPNDRTSPVQLTPYSSSSIDYTLTYHLSRANNSTLPSEKIIILTTNDIQLVITPSPFCITWKKAPTSSTCVTINKQQDDDDDWFAQDLADRSYCYDPHHGTRWHYQRRKTGGENDMTGTFYFGLGERTGRLNLGGRRFRLDRTDAMGYDAETQDPLYKFCPFYVGLTSSSSSPTEAYGIYYNNFSRTLFDLGKERDAVSSLLLDVKQKMMLMLFSLNQLIRCGAIIRTIKLKRDHWTTI
jgi:alpha-glucosidase